MPPDTAPPTIDDALAPPPAVPGTDLDRFLRHINHTRHNRLVRFWRVAGPITVAQFLFATLFFGYGLLLGVRGGLAAGAVATVILIAPCILAYFTRNFFLRHFRVARRILNLAAACLLVFFLYYISAKPTLPLPVALAVIAYMPFHMSTMFWVLSDRQISPNRDRWWHG